MKNIFWFLLFLPVKSFAKAVPVAATQISSEVDQMYFFIHTLSLGFGLLIVGAFVTFAILYRRKEKTRRLKHEFITICF